MQNANPIFAEMCVSTSTDAPVGTSDDTKLLAAPPPSRRSMALGIALAAASQLGWGCYPVLARVLQTRAPVLTTLELLVATNILAASALIVGTMAKYLVRLACGGGKAVNDKAGSCTTSQRHTLLVLGFGFVIFTRAVTNVASAAYAPAHWCVMISLCTPWFTAGIGKFVFGEAMPPGTLPALLCGMLGSALAIFGGSGGGDDDGNAQTSATEAELALGIGLALLSTIFLAIYQHCVKRTKGLLSAGSILALNYVVVSVPCVLILGGRQASRADDVLGNFVALRARQWIYLVAFSLGVYLCSNLAQQIAIRQLGATLLSAVMPMRLLSSVIGSYCVLGERISGPLEATGLLVVAATAAAYLGRQVLLSRRKPQQQTAASAPETELSSTCACTCTCAVESTGERSDAK